MANHANSVFGASAVSRTWLSTTRIPAYNTGSDGNGYVEGFPSYADLNNLPAIPFRPTGKYAPLELSDDVEWADGKPHAEQHPTATHDASAGAVPSYTTAKYGSICIVTVAGTLGSNTLLENDILVALQDNPTTAAHWAVISDCTDELEAAIEAAQGAPLDLTGITIMADSLANPNARLNIRGGRWGVRSGRCGLYQQANTDKIASESEQGTVTAISIAGYSEPNTGTTLARCTALTMSATDAAKFEPEMMVMLSCDAPTPNTAGSSSKCFVKEAAYVRAVELNGSSSKVYLSKILWWHSYIASNATTIYLNTNPNADRSAIIEDTHLMGMPTIIGESVGWWRTLRGDEVSGTISGSGTTRTITRTGHNLKIKDDTIGRSADYVQLTAVSGDGSVGVTCPVTAVTSTTFTVTVPTKYDFNSSNPQSGLPTSGTIYYKPCFGNSNNTTNHGAVLCIVHSPRSRIRYSASKLWKMALKPIHSDFTSIIETYSRDSFASQTDSNNGASGRLIYDIDNTACTDLMVWFWDNQSGRHPYTTDGKETSGSFSTSTWYGNCGNSVGGMVRGVGYMSDSGTAETHEGSIGIDIEYVFGGAYRRAGEQSYNEVWGNLRGIKERRILRGRGGHEGPVFRAFEQTPDSYHEIDFDIADIYYAGSSNVGMRSEAFDALTNPPRIRGNARFRNVGYGFKFLKGIDCQLQKFSAHDVPYAAGWLNLTTTGDGVFSADEATIDYRQNTRGSTTRYGFLAEGTAKYRFGTLRVNMGATYNPAELFTDSDNISGKEITIDRLVISDPSLVGMPNIVTSGREANFTIKIATIVYNGRRISVSGFSYKDISRLAIYATNSNLTWTSMPAAETVLGGTSAGIIRADLTGYSECRLVARQGTAGASGAKLIARYNASLYAATTIANWSANIGTSEVSVPIDSASNTFQASSWIPLASGAKADVTIAIVGSGGDGATSPVFGGIALEVR